MYGAALYRLRAEDFGELVHHDGISPAWPISYDVMERITRRPNSCIKCTARAAARSTHRESARVGTAHGESRHTIGCDAGERFLSNPRVC
jgi:choline dehydrogenase-like flavoprotein